jgi:dUTP pyrophosphatase
MKMPWSIGMQVKFKKLDPKAVIPSYAKDGDAGLDITAISANKNGYTGNYEYRSGLSVEIPKGYVGLIFPRSSVCKKALSLCNSVGVIDSGYRGEILFFFKETPYGDGAYQVGDRIGQLVIIPFPKIDPVEVEELSESERGEGGIGSTGA